MSGSTPFLTAAVPALAPAVHAEQVLAARCVKVRDGDTLGTVTCCAQDSQCE